MKRKADLERKTKETQIAAALNLDGSGEYEISTDVGFLDHMLALFAAHGLFDLNVSAQGDIEVDYHHTVEDVGLVIGSLINKALGTRKGIVRYGQSAVPMDDALAEVVIDLSNRPYLVFRQPAEMPRQNVFDASLAKEFFRAVAQKSGMNLHITIVYGENWHHMIEAVFKAFARALRQAVAMDGRRKGVPSTKGSL
ncbi:MAG: imidazoleglycerol-phosphate dehydratase HisB [Desulfobacteraceae bacterium]|jgi:imidazoleglycerol-phosphate dehydratase